jgi:hypothetical protein
MNMTKPENPTSRGLSKAARKRRKGNPHGRGKAPKVTLPATPTSWDKGATGPANRERLRSEPATDIDPETGRETPNPNGVNRMRRDPWVIIYANNGHLTRAQVDAANELFVAAEGKKERDPLAAIVKVRQAGTSDPEADRVDARAYFWELWAMVPRASRPVVDRVVINNLPIWHGCGAAAWKRHMSRLIAGLDAIA